MQVSTCEDARRLNTERRGGNGHRAVKERECRKNDVQPSRGARKLHRFRDRSLNDGVRFTPVIHKKQCIQERLSRKTAVLDNT